MDNAEQQNNDDQGITPQDQDNESPNTTPHEESFIVQNHRQVLETLGLDVSLMMSERVFASNRGEFQAVQIVSGSDLTQSGKALVSELMQYEHFRRAFIDEVPTYYEETPDKFKAGLQSGMVVANELIKDAEKRFGALPPSDKPTKRELKLLREQYGERISLREMPELMLAGAAAVVEGYDEKFGNLGILSEDGFDAALDNAVVMVHKMEQSSVEQNVKPDAVAAPEPAKAPAEKKPRTPRTPRTPKPDLSAVSVTEAKSVKKTRKSAPKVPASEPRPADSSQLADTPAAVTLNAEPIIKVLSGEPGTELTPDERNQLSNMGWSDDQLSDIPAYQARTALVDPADTQVSALATAPQQVSAEKSETGPRAEAELKPTPVTLQESVENPEPSRRAEAESKPAVETQQESVVTPELELQPAAEPKVAVAEETSDSLPTDEVMQPRQANAGSNEATMESQVEADSIWVGPRRGVDEPRPESSLIDKDALLSRLDSKVQEDKSVLYTLDGEPAFVDRGMRLEMADGAGQSDEKVLAALLTAAEFYRGRLELTGSEAFQRKAIGLIAQYQPNVTMKKPDQQMMLVEARKALKADPVVKDAIHGEASPAPGSTASPSAEAAPVAASPVAAASAAEPVSPAPVQHGLAATSEVSQAQGSQPAVATSNTAQTNVLPAAGEIPSPGNGFTKTRPSDIHENHQTAANGVIGKVMGSGDAPFQFDENNTKSTYITLRTKTGVQTYWGKELASLLRDTRVTPGKVVTLQWLGKEPVTIQVPIKDEHGAVKRYEPKDTHRNKWSLQVMGEPAVRTGQDEGVKLVAYDANRFAQVQQTVLSRLRLDIPLPEAPNDGLYWMTPDGQGSFKSGDPLTAPRPPTDNAVAGHPVISSYSPDGSLELALFRSDGPFLQGVVRQNGHYQHVLVSLPNREDAPPMVFNAITPTCLAPIGVGNGINKSGGQPVSRENIAFRLDGDSTTRIGKLDKPAEVPATLHARLGFDERWRDDNTLPKSAPAAAPTVQPSEPRPA